MLDRRLVVHSATLERGRTLMCVENAVELVHSCFVEHALPPPDDGQGTLTSTAHHRRRGTTRARAPDGWPATGRGLLLACLGTHCNLMATARGPRPRGWSSAVQSDTPDQVADGDVESTDDASKRPRPQQLIEHNDVADASGRRRHMVERLAVVLNWTCVDTPSTS